jgi:hypothetical protein
MKINRIPAILIIVIISLLISFSASTAFSQEWNPKQRPARLVSQTPDGVFTITNARFGFNGDTTDNPNWRTVTIDSKKVKNVYFVLKPFAPEWIAAHSLFYFELETPMTTEKGEKSSGIYLSIEARLLKGQKYDLFKGNFDNFKIVYTLCSAEDYRQLIKMDSLSGGFIYKLIPYKLNLNQAQKAALLKNTLEWAVKNRDNEFYNTADNNCTNNLFLLLNKVLPPNNQFPKSVLVKFLPNMKISIPRLSYKTLKKHGMIAEVMPITFPDIPAGMLQKQLLPPAEVEQKKKEIFTQIALTQYELIRAITNLDITKNKLRAILYDSEAEQVLYLHVPPVELGVAGSCEFTIGPDFSAQLEKCASGTDMAKLVIDAFTAYKAVLSKRVEHGDPDIFKYVSARMAQLKKITKDAASSNTLK